ncbi:hypothetical protein HPB48_007730 [Haemaphysalis longicornis]|uniref:Uncharacterized protein n=1 Tax=Haemaphysalis longicornis TaxID=44386 RepID=A0A9J6G3U4_HAELO|nr:hypothetical protein HPB48_007730 [Haemaphysalis longicornis]
MPVVPAFAEDQFCLKRGRATTECHPMAQDKESMWSVLKACDKSNGYIFSQSEEQHMMTLAMRADTQQGDSIARLRERLETSGTTCLVDEEAAMDDTSPCGSPQ